jgi:hypothetical protein
VRDARRRAGRLGEVARLARADPGLRGLEHGHRGRARARPPAASRRSCRRPVPVPVTTDRARHRVIGTPDSTSASTDRRGKRARRRCSVARGGQPQPAGALRHGRRPETPTRSPARRTARGGDRDLGSQAPPDTTADGGGGHPRGRRQAAAARQDRGGRSGSARSTRSAASAAPDAGRGEAGVEDERAGGVDQVRDHRARARPPRRPGCRAPWTASRWRRRRRRPPRPCAASSPRRPARPRRARAPRPPPAGAAGAADGVQLAPGVRAAPSTEFTAVVTTTPAPRRGRRAARRRRRGRRAG